MAAEGLSTASSGCMSRRDTAVEDEVFHCGYFADTAFCFRHGVSRDVEKVFGQGGLFALFSPALREKLFPPKAAAPPPPPPAAAAAMPGKAGNPQDVQVPSHCREVWLDNGVTVRGFQEVARYVYRLAPKLTFAALPEILDAAMKLAVSELEESALTWGLEAMAEVNGIDVEDGASSSMDDALRCLELLCGGRALHPTAPAWREALLKAYPAAAVLATPMFLELSAASLRELLQSEELHCDPGDLWRSLLAWAKLAHAREEPPPAEDKPSAAPRRLFGAAARPMTERPPPDLTEAEWQRLLVPFCEAVRFAIMEPRDFALHVEALDPMLPELRRAIYASRRRGVASTQH